MGLYPLHCRAGACRDPSSRRTGQRPQSQRLGASPRGRSPAACQNPGPAAAILAGRRHRQGHSDCILCGQIPDHQFLGYLVRTLPHRNTPASGPALRMGGPRRDRGRHRGRLPRQGAGLRQTHENQLSAAHGRAGRAGRRRGPGVDSPVFPFTVFTDRRGEVVALFIGELHRPQAELILAEVQNLDKGSIELPAARKAIAEGLQALQAQRAD